MCIRDRAETVDQRAVGRREDLRRLGDGLVPLHLPAVDQRPTWTRVVVHEDALPARTGEAHLADLGALRLDREIVAEAPAERAGDVLDHSRHDAPSLSATGAMSTFCPLNEGMPVPKVSVPMSLLTSVPMGTKTSPAGKEPAWAVSSTSPSAVRRSACPPSSILRRTMSSGFISTSAVASRYSGESLPLCMPIACLRVRPVIMVSRSLTAPLLVLLAVSVHRGRAREETGKARLTVSAASQHRAHGMPGGDTLAGRRYVADAADQPLVCVGDDDRAPCVRAGELERQDVAAPSQSAAAQGGTPEELLGKAEDAPLLAVGHERDRGRATVHLGLQHVGVVQRPAVPRGDAVTAAAAPALSQPAAAPGAPLLPAEQGHRMGDPGLPAEASQQRPVTHVPKHLGRVAEQPESGGQVADHLGVVLEVGAVHDGVGVHAASRLRQPRRRERQAEISLQRVALRKSRLIAIAEEVHGHDLVAATDRGLDHGPRAHSEDEDAHYPASSLARAKISSASRTRSFCSKRRTIERRWTFILRSPMARAPKTILPSTSLPSHVALVPSRARGGTAFTSPSTRSVG